MHVRELRTIRKPLQHGSLTFIPHPRAVHCREQNPSSRLATPPSPASFKALSPGVSSVTEWLGWNTALGDSCPHQQTASLNLINMSSLSALVPSSALIKTISLPVPGGPGILPVLLQQQLPPAPQHKDRSSGKPPPSKGWSAAPEPPKAGGPVRTTGASPRQIQVTFPTGNCLTLKFPGTREVAEP